MAADKSSSSLTPTTPPLPTTPPPIILHDGFLSPPPAFPLDPHVPAPAVFRPISPLPLPLNALIDIAQLTDDTFGPLSAILAHTHLDPTSAGSPKNDNAGDDDSQRPPIRPNAGVRSRFEQEPNPFEQSFSRESHHSGSSDSTTPPRGTDATSTRHNALPPLSSLTSPAASDPTQFPWLASQSLRSGPLSPAMLTGPQGAIQPQNQSHLRPTNGQAETNGANPVEGAAPSGFEGTGFRTGFTPGTGSGFTPNYNSFMGSGLGALPIPSPNTAAFLNSITNVTPLAESSDVAAAANAASTAPHPHPHPPHIPHQPHDPLHPPSAIPPHMQAHHPIPPHGPPAPDVQETITPNTLSALTGVFGDMSRAQPPAPGAPPQQYFAPGMPAGAPHPHPHQQHPQHPHPHGHHPVPVAMPPYVDYAQHNANAASQAANGLFLLSQAHQELSKREEAESASPQVGGRRTTSRAAANGAAAAAPAPAQGTKRKSDAAGGAGGKAPAAKKGRKSGGTPKGGNAKQESTSPAFSHGADSDEEGGGEGKDGEQKFETEEDKRKNFLERNRQAALKCRQRKKAWLNELQSKVEGLTIENERLQQTVQSMHEEVGRLTAILMQHRDCGLGIPVPYGRPIR
ncbi:hypothetical protein IAT38_000514 [Cryptococcus sp. DSM 104549]